MNSEIKELFERIPGFIDVVEAQHRIKDSVNRTPVMTCAGLNSMAGCDLFFKCENFQKVGAFKFRGATNTLMQLPEELLRRGVATHSSGNHAAALALAAKQRGAKAYIVMPQNAPEVKKKAVKGYGADITYCIPTLEERERNLNRIVEETGATFVHPYNISTIIAGQGTATLELLNDFPDLDIVMAPVGGGGLLSGTAIAAKGYSSRITVIAGEPEGADDAYRSFVNKEFIPSVNPDTIADGLLTSLGSMTFQIISGMVDEIYTVSDSAIIGAMRLIWERMKIVVEPSSAVPFAVVLSYPEVFANKKIGIIVSGGNVDLATLPFTA